VPAAGASVTGAATARPLIWADATGVWSMGTDPAYSARESGDDCCRHHRGGAVAGSEELLAGGDAGRDPVVREPRPHDQDVMKGWASDETHQASCHTGAVGDCVLAPPDGFEGSRSKSSDPLAWYAAVLTSRTKAITDPRATFPAESPRGAPWSRRVRAHSRAW
jgi:hypothetical protein